MNQELKRTRLYDWHVAHGARMVPFAGWEMPVQYPTGPIEEHHLTRRSAGLFDIDHMGQVEVSGPEAEAYLNHLVTWDVSAMTTNEAHYALMCYENGGIVDVIFIYRRPERWLVVINPMAGRRPSPTTRWHGASRSPRGSSSSTATGGCRPSSPASSAASSDAHRPPWASNAGRVFARILMSSQIDQPSM